MAGRPNSKYTPERGEHICELITEGYTLRQIEPLVSVSKRTILRWLAKEPEFRRLYSQAYEIWAEAMSHEILDIANDGSNDWVERETVTGRKERVVDHEHVQRSKLRVDALKWLMAHRVPKRWGDLTRHTGPEGNDPVAIESISQEERRRQIRAEIDAAFPERARPDYEPPSPPPPPAPEKEPEHVVREFATEGDLAVAPDVPRLPMRYRPPRILGDWSG